MGKDNPKMAAEQLGITGKIFDKHYNQPDLDDRIARRDLLPGAGFAGSEDEKRIGTLYMQMRRGLVSEQEFEREVNRSLLADATNPRPKALDPSYG